MAGSKGSGTRIGVKRTGYGGKNIPELDGTPGCMGDAKVGQSYCTLCGAMGHKATAHANGKALVRDDSTAGVTRGTSKGPTGPALKADRAASSDFNDGPDNTGGKGWKPDGYAFGLT